MTDRQTGKEKKNKTGFLSLKRIFGIKSGSSSKHEKNYMNALNNSNTPGF